MPAGRLYVQNFLSNNESSPMSFTLFQKSFPAGTVSLGPQNNGGVGMYTVIVR